MTDSIQGLAPSQYAHAVFKRQVKKIELADPHVDVTFAGGTPGMMGSDIVIRFGTGEFARKASELRVGEVVEIAIMRKRRGET